MNVNGHAEDTLPGIISVSVAPFRLHFHRPWKVNGGADKLWVGWGGDGEG